MATATPNSSGYYALTVAGGLPIGTHNLKVLYTGDTNYSALSITLPTVTSATDFIVPSFTSPALVGQAYPVNVSFTGSLVNDTPRTGTLSLVSGSSTLLSIDISQVSPNANGSYTLYWAAGPNAGSNSLAVVYSGALALLQRQCVVCRHRRDVHLHQHLAVLLDSSHRRQSYTVNAAINGTL